MPKVEWKLINILGLRQGETSEVPWKDSGVTFIHVKPDGTVVVDRSVKKYHIVHDFKKNDLLLAAWTGQYRTDIFEMDISILRKDQDYRWYVKKHPEEFKKES